MDYKSNFVYQVDKHLLIVYTRPNGSQLVTLYPLRVPTEIHLQDISSDMLYYTESEPTHEKSWLKFANSMFEFVFSTILYGKEKGYSR